MPLLRSFTVTSTAPNGDPVVHSCTTAEEEAAVVDELRAIGHAGIESTETREYRFLGKFSALTISWTRRRDEAHGEPAALEAQPALGHEVYLRIRPNAWVFSTGQAEPRPRGGLAVPYVPNEDVPGFRLLWQRAAPAARWRELVAWPVVTLLSWFAGIYVILALGAALISLV